MKLRTWTVGKTPTDIALRIPGEAVDPVLDRDDLDRVFRSANNALSKVLDSGDYGGHRRRRGDGGEAMV